MSVAFTFAGVLIGNKSDFRDPTVDRACVSVEEATAFAVSVGLKYFETSAVSFVHSVIR